MHRFDVFSRQGCHLCEVLIEQLLELVAGRADVRVHDVDLDPEWQRQYGIRVPVVVFGGAVICETQLDIAAVRSALAEKA